MDFVREAPKIKSVQVVPLTPLTEAIVKEPDLGVTFIDWVEDGALTEVTITTYDRPLMSSGDILVKFKQGKQQNLRLRVAAVAYFDVFVIGTTDPQADYQSAIHYSYDLHSNVLEVLQDVPMMAPVEQDIKSAQYEFELISGNVKKVKYQQDERDQMTHSYTYDKLNRLTEVHTSTDGEVHESREAHYRYFDYGPLARVEIGEHKVQAKDHAYTINGWLKGMNSNTLKPNRDMGLDGETGYLAANSDLHELIARDVTGYTLGYYQGDYFSRGTTSFEADLGTGNDLTDILKDLFNGNISHTVTAIEGFDVQAGAYSYDQLQRLKQMRVFRGVDVVLDNDWISALETSEYYSDYSYDLNGNITELNRNGNSTTGLDMDEFVYNLTTVSSNPSNRLDYVTDNGTNYGAYADIKTGQSASNYDYDKLGQLVADAQEGMTLQWRKGDKKLLLQKNATTQLEFVYNPLGQRVCKIEKPVVAGVAQPQSISVYWKYTYYTYDANGQLMGTYDADMNSGTGYPDDFIAELKELMIYGSGRLGVVEPARLVYENGNALDYTYYGDDGIFLGALGQKKYELTNHLGNVDAVITDRKIVSSGGATSIYEAVIIMKSDYYPFGMPMPGRSTDIDQYRFGYNGMEKDPEMKGEGNSYTTEFRQYDPRLGRWMSLDPLMMQSPWQSPYCAFDNNPVFYTDPYGLSTTNKDGGTDDPDSGFASECDDGKVVSEKVFSHDSSTGPSNQNELKQRAITDVDRQTSRPFAPGFDINLGFGKFHVTWSKTLGNGQRGDFNHDGKVWLPRVHIQYEGWYVKLKFKEVESINLKWRSHKRYLINFDNADVGSSGTETQISTNVPQELTPKITIGTPNFTFTYGDETDDIWVRWDTYGNDGPKSPIPDRNKNTAIFTFDGDTYSIRWNPLLIAGKSYFYRKLNGADFTTTSGTLIIDVTSAAVINENGDTFGYSVWRRRLYTLSFAVNFLIPAGFETGYKVIGD